MKIRFFFESHKKFYLYKSKNLGVIVIGLYLFSIQIIYKKDGVDMYKVRNRVNDKIRKAYNQKCEICGGKLKVNSVNQIYRYHKECKPFRNQGYRNRHQKEYTELLKPNV